MGQTSRSFTFIVLFFAWLACLVKSCILFTINIIWEARFQFYQFIILTNGVPHFPSEISHDRLTFLASCIPYWRLSSVESAGQVFTETKQGQLRSVGKHTKPLSWADLYLTLCLCFRQQPLPAGSHHSSFPFAACPDSQHSFHCTRIYLSPWQFNTLVKILVKSSFVGWPLIILVTTLHSCISLLFFCRHTANGNRVEKVAVELLWQIPGIMPCPNMENTGEFSAKALSSWIWMKRQCLSWYFYDSVAAFLFSEDSSSPVICNSDAHTHIAAGEET